MLFILYLGLGFLVLRFLLTLINFISKPLLQARTLQRFPRLSILIPARDEAHNLPNLFQALSAIDYPDLEILILNDNSSDETEVLLAQAATQIPELRYLNGKPLPSGWIGKTWACHQLAEAATGEYFLFLDADIAVLKPELIPSALWQVQDKRLALLSLFPDQIMESTGEKLVVPLMHYLLLSLLPLWAIYYLPFPSMAAANGQFMLFDAEVYREYRWHQRVKSIITEDIAIMQQVKAQQQKGLTLLGNRMIFCRMYHSYQEGISGFSRNILAGFGNQIFGLLIYLLLILGVWALSFPLISPSLMLISVVLMLGIRAMISLLANQPLAFNLFAHPVQMSVLVRISILSIYKRLIKQKQWKGRNVYSDLPSSS